MGRVHTGSELSLMTSEESLEESCIRCFWVIQLASANSLVLVCFCVFEILFKI